MGLNAVTKLTNFLIGKDNIEEVVEEVVEKNGNKKEEAKNVPFMQVNGKITKKGVTIVTIGDGPTLALIIKESSMALGRDEFTYINEMMGGRLKEETDLVWAEAYKIKVNDNVVMALKEDGERYEYDGKKSNTFNVGKKIDPDEPAEPKSKPKSKPKAKPSTS